MSPKHDAVESIRLPTAILGFPVKGFPNAIPLLWQVGSLDEAIAWVKRCPNPHDGDSEIEIRPVFAPEDFGDALTPELREREAQLRGQLEGAKTS